MGQRPSVELSGIHPARRNRLFDTSAFPGVTFKIQSNLKLKLPWWTRGRTSQEKGSETVLTIRRT